MTCDICEENFTRSELKKHKSKVHGIACNEEQSVAELPFKCPFCLKGFKTKLGLQRHSENFLYSHPYLPTQGAPLGLSKLSLTNAQNNKLQPVLIMSAVYTYLVYTFHFLTLSLSIVGA